MDLIAYVRVSSRNQIDGNGLDVQERQIRQWAKRNGHKIVDVYQDAGRSGTSIDRPGLSAAIAALRPPPQANGLIVARMDRLARALHVQESILTVVWGAGATVFTADTGEVLQDDPDDPMRTFIRQVVGGVAQLERALVVKRMRDGRAAKREAGRKAVGGYAFGYHGEGTGKERDAAPLSDEQATILRILDLRNGGAPYRQIAATLDAEGRKPRRADRWHAPAVRNIVEREQASK